MAENGIGRLYWCCKISIRFCHISFSAMKQYRQAQFKHLWQRKRPKFWYVMPPQPSWPLATLRCTGSSMQSSAGFRPGPARATRICCINSRRGDQKACFHWLMLCLTFMFAYPPDLPPTSGISHNRPALLLSL